MIDDETLEKFDRTIDILEFEEVDILVRAEKGIKIIKEVLNKTRNSVVNRSFKSKQKEIHFFKVVKPKVFSKLIYYVKLFNIESKRPRGSNKSQIKYFNSHIERLQIYFNDNLEFYHYYRRNATSLDEQYFLRGKADIRLYPDTFHFFSDEQFSTSHDCTVATILAYDMLIVHLKTVWRQQFHLLENSQSFFGLDIKPI